MPDDFVFVRAREIPQETLASALQERLEVISDQDLRTKDPEAQLRRLHLASERIDRLKQGLPADADPMLKHFLERMSLTKALELIQSRYLAEDLVGHALVWCASYVRTLFARLRPRFFARQSCEGPHPSRLLAAWEPRTFDRYQPHLA